MLGFASTVMASWEVLLVLFKLTLITGGFPNLFWGFIVNVCGMLFVYASIAELASMYVSYLLKSPVRRQFTNIYQGLQLLGVNTIGFLSSLLEVSRSP